MAITLNSFRDRVVLCVSMKCPERRAVKTHPTLLVQTLPIIAYYWNGIFVSFLRSLILKIAGR